ncbi:MAG TPA: DUF378 domain-containing protein [Longimicrobiales bacterium]
MKQLDIIAAILLITGGLNWGLVALFNFDLVAAITGAGGFGSRNLLGIFIYGLVGLAALYYAATLRSVQRARS